MSRLRVAWASPLPPSTSGIADYSAELLPVLAQQMDLELYVEDPRGLPEDLCRAHEVHPLEQLPADRGRRDLVVYQLGNHPAHHGAIYRMALAEPGVVVLHEFVLHHLVRGITVDRNDLDAYHEEMRYAYGERAAAAALRGVLEGSPVDPWRYPLFERAVDAAAGVLVHSQTTRDRVRASRPAARIAVVPHHLSLAGLERGEDPRRWRASFGLPEEAFVVGSYGHLTPQKRLDVVLRAFARLHRRLPQARLLLAGEVAPHFDLGPWLSALPPEAVVLTGRLPLARLLEAMAVCDVAVNLRHPSGGETSGTLMRLLGMGRPVCVSATGAFAETPPGACIRIPLDPCEEDLLLAQLVALSGDPGLRRRMGRLARRHMELHHDLGTSARGYVAFLERIAADPRPPFRPVPPLAAGRIDAHRDRFLLRLGRKAADLGVHEGHRDLLASWAGSAVALGFGAPDADR